MAALLAGAGARVVGDAPWLEPVPRGDGVRLVASTSPADRGDATTLVYRPQVAVLGVGCARDCPPAELDRLAEKVLRKAGSTGVRSGGA